MSTKVTGNYGYVSVDGFTLHVTKWSLTDKAEIEDSTTTESNGWQDVESVLNMADGTVEAFLDYSNLPTAATPNLVGGRVIDAMLLFVGDPTDDKKWSMKAQVKEVNHESMVKGLLKYNFTFTSKGAVTRPE